MSLGWFPLVSEHPFDIADKTIRKTISSLDKPRRYEPEKYQVYLHLPYCSVASFLDDKVKDIVGNTYGAVKLRIAHFTKTLQIEIFKDVTLVQEKHNVLYHFKCYCDSDYVGRISQIFHKRRDQQVTKSLRNWCYMETKKIREAVLRSLQSICIIFRNAPNIMRTIYS